MSISSFEGSPVPLDLPTKYEKLAAEYAKVRSQVSVLKKAVLDEQLRTAQLRDELKIKEQTLRKNDQELESLNFRNLQLTKRVTVLQEEFERTQETSKKGRPKTGTIHTFHDDTILQEELEKKIAENARLALLLDESNAEHEREIAKWRTVAAQCKPCLDEQGSSEVKGLPREVALNNNVHDRVNHEKNVNVIRSPWALLKTLPVVELLNSVDRLIVACVKSSSTLVVLEDCQERLAQVAKAWRAESHENVIHSLELYLTSLKSVVDPFKSGEIRSLANEIWKHLTQLKRSLEPCFLPNQSHAQFRSAVSGVAIAARSFRGTLNRRASEQSEGGTSRPFDPTILVALSAVLSSVASVWKLANTGLVQDDHSEESSARSELDQPCSNCSIYLENIAELKKRVSPTIPALGIKSSMPLESSCEQEVNETVVNAFGTAVHSSKTASDAEFEKVILNKMNSVIADRQRAESKLTTILLERDTELCRLEQCTERLDIQSALALKLQEELSTTTKNYEEQLSSMSEHMANMNDRLAAQQSQIEELMFEISSKDNKRSGRQK